MLTGWFGFLLLPCMLMGRSTSGPVARNLTIDGVVGILAAPGTNSGAWEQDELLEGPAGGVDWLMSWDDQNLYLARSGGNNSHASAVIVHAGYAGASMSMGIPTLGSFNPGMDAMGGANAVVFLRSGQDFLQSFSGGGWSTADSSLAPQFSFGAVQEMEVAIPWDLLTGGNGKPDHFRLVLTQYAEDSLPLGCSSGHWTYGISPWGTGTAGSGPSIGVNDGVGISWVQPEGCGAGLDSLTRWWGCFPVSDGIGPAVWAHPLPEAGPDTSICTFATGLFLQGNTVPAGAQGVWEIIAQPPGAAASLLDPNDPLTLLQGMSMVGTYVLTWSFDLGGCGPLPDTLVVTRQAAVPQADAGPDIALACDSASVLLQALNNGPFGGRWELISGQGHLSQPDSMHCWVDSLSRGLSVWVWNIQGGACPSTTDTLEVLVSHTVLPDAGPDQDLCDQTSTFLSAVDPRGVQPTAWGKWFPIATPTNVYIRDSVDPASEFFNLGPGSYNLAWRVENGTCPVREDTVRIRVFASPISDAGNDLVQCHLGDLQLSGNDPLLQGTFTLGYWVQRDGPSLVAFSDSSQQNALISGLAPGTYRFDWVLNNGFCPADVDGMTLIVEELSHEGLDTLVHPVAGTSNGWIEVATPQSGFPPFLFALGAGGFQVDSIFESLNEGAYTLTLMDGIGCTDTLMFQLLETNSPGPGPSDSLFIPDGFSPNGDGVNDFWEIPGIARYPEAKVEVFSTWGISVFRSSGAYSPWDGRHQGKELPQGTYYFTVDLRAAGIPVQKGALTLVR